MPRRRKDDWLHRIPVAVGSYLAGFVDGEGSFVVSLKRRPDHTLGWQIVPTFSVAQRDKTVLALLKRHLGCGRLTRRRDGVWVYAVSNPRMLAERVVPFFRTFRFLSSSKMKNFRIFARIVAQLVREPPETPEALKELIALREQLNEGAGRKRKYSLDDFTAYFTENPQRLYARASSRRKRNPRGDA